VVEAIKAALDGMQVEEIVLVARSNAQLATYATRLQAAGIASSKIEARTSGGVGVQLATMHQVKGLEFRAAFLVGCSAAQIWAKKGLGSLESKRKQVKKGIQSQEKDVQTHHLLRR
jgi:superfamily I DNA/RNA helicase